MEDCPKTTETEKKTEQRCTEGKTVVKQGPAKQCKEFVVGDKPITGLKPVRIRPM